ncbi:pathogenesis-related protein 1-like [Cryptomeria japonica]|uniref:pathogenesis-related protein 1-like n=1 Tax=Cryptomeria japonica TaxID=3369 RepID=UPI0025ABBCD5|nr:pathogenesis-related protein 1-like [Cryptomeria japonica]
MVAASVTIQVESEVAAKRLWNALVKDHSLIAREMPELCTGVTFLQEYDIVNDSTGATEFSYVKERVDVVDEENFIYSYTDLEGGELGKNLKSAQFTLKMSPKAEGGSVVTHICNFDTLPGVPQEESKLEAMKAQLTALFKKMEAYVIANPTLYNA